MKRLIYLFFCMIATGATAQFVPEKEVVTKVEEVTVFLEGAQITRSTTLQLPEGKHLLRFIQLSPFIDAGSIQLKTTGPLTVLSVNHQQNHLDPLQKPAAVLALEQKLETIDKEIKLGQTRLSIVKDEIAFLYDNRQIGGKNESVNPVILQQSADFYGGRMTSLKMKEIDLDEKLQEMFEKRKEIIKQLDEVKGVQQYASGEVQVQVDVNAAGKFSFDLRYLTQNASWYPSYDLRAKSVTEPLQLIYKANVKQDTKENWENVQLRFSSANPHISGTAPLLQTYYLNYGLMPPVYTQHIAKVSGRVGTINGDPIPFVNVVVEGTTIGTTTNAEGYYSISIPGPDSRLTFSFVGYDRKTLKVTNPVMNVLLRESVISLEEVEVANYVEGIRYKGMQKAAVAGISQLDAAGEESPELPVEAINRAITVDFEVQMPYTILSDNKNYVVDMQRFEVPAAFQYHSVPKLEKDVFLMAGIYNWEQFSLLDAEANIFFDNTFIGTTLLNLSQADDTLKISLGRDQNIHVSREKIKDFSVRQLLGGKKEEVRAWKNTIRNNRQELIRVIVFDQVPVSMNEEIEVSIMNYSGAKHDPQTGMIRWEIELLPGESRELELRYVVKYPKQRELYVE